MTVASQLVTAEEFPEIPDSDEFELVDGHLIERKRMGADACAVAARIIILLGNFIKARHAGWIMTSELTYRCFPNPQTLRRPDVSFVRRGRFVGDKLPPGHLTIVPDLAVEVISPNDTVYDLNSKLRDYRSANFPLVWVVYPDTQEVQIYRNSQRAEILTLDQQIPGETALPGFECAVREFYEDVPWMEASGQRPEARMAVEINWERSNYESRVDLAADGIESFADAVLDTIDLKAARSSPRQWDVVCRFLRDAVALQKRKGTRLAPAGSASPSIWRRLFPARPRDPMTDFLNLWTGFPSPRIFDRPCFGRYLRNVSDRAAIIEK